MRWLLILAVAISVAACGGDDDDSEFGDAEDRMVEAVDTFLKNQAGRTYDEYLLPSQRELIDRDLFIDCNTETGGIEADVEVDESYAEPQTVPTIGENVETVAVTYVMSVGDESATDTSHLVDVDGEWYIFYAQEDLDTFVAGECP